MSRKVLKADLFKSADISRLIKEVNSYRDSLTNKCELFVKRLSEIGIPIIDKNISSAEGDSDKSHYTHIEINSYGAYSQAKLICEGQDLLFIEFGAGIHYNGAGSPHPLGKEMGYTIGSYGKGQGKNDFWFYYKDSGEAVMSHGTQATMPMYKAAVEMRSQILNIAREVFGG